MIGEFVEIKALEAAPGTQRPLSIEKGPLGVTVYARLASAPYPHPEEPYSDDTVAIFIPSALQADGDGNLDVLLHLHGHYNNVGHVLATQRLREQLAETGRAPLLVLPQLPFDAEDSSPGFLGEAGGLARLLEEVFEVVREPSVQAALARPTPAGARPGRVVLSAHSGGYKAAGQAAKLGGVDVSVCGFCRSGQRSVTRHCGSGPARMDKTASLNDSYRPNVADEL